MAQNPQQRKYVPNVSSLHGVCDANYLRLLKLLPDCDTQDLQFNFGVQEELQYRITITECCRYTTTLHMTQVLPVLPEYMKPAMTIRLYHDARMAEVIEAQHVGALAGSYPYPNRRMHQKNEKELTNRFLSEWLSFCLANRASAASTPC